MKECELIKGGHTFGLLAVTPFLVLVHSVCLPANETVTHVLSLFTETSCRSPSVGSFERPQRRGAIRGGCIQSQPTDNNEAVNSIQWRVRFSIEPH